MLGKMDGSEIRSLALPTWYDRSEGPPDVKYVDQEADQEAIHIILGQETLLRPLMNCIFWIVLL